MDKNRLKRRINSNKGSITLFVVISMMVIMLILVAVFMTNSAKLSAQAKQIELIQDQYDDEMAEVYEELHF